MELRQLQFAVAVARFQSFTRAAESLHVAQPSLSMQVRKLEGELGVRLFDRTTRHVSLTLPGQVFIARAEQIVAECATAAREMTEYASGLRGKVRVGAWYTINPGLPDLLGSFVRAYPGVELTVREENTDLMLDLVRRGDLDVALPVMRNDLDLRGIDHFIYLTEPFVLVTAPDSPLAVLQEVSLEEISAAPLISFKPGSAVRALVEGAFAAIGVRPLVTIEITETHAGRAFVSKGLGVTLIPRSVAEVEGPPIAIVPVRGAPIRRSAIVWRSNGRTSATNAFIDHVRAIYPDAPILQGESSPPRRRQLG